MAEGETHLIETFYLFRESNHKVNYSLAYTLAHLYDSAKAERYVETQVNQPQVLRISALIEDFQVYEYGNLNFNCSALEDKIVIAGYLGPGDEDKFWTWGRFWKDSVGRGQPDTYATELIANEVLQILKEESNED